MQGCGALAYCDITITVQGGATLLPLAGNTRQRRAVSSMLQPPPPASRDSLC